MKLASCKSALNPPVVCSTDRFKAVVPVLVLLFVALWFILRGNLLYVFPCVILSLKNTKFAEYLEFIYPRELEIKETTETSASSSYLDCYLYIDNGKLTTRLYDKRDDFNFPIVNFPFLSSNIPSAPAYGVYVSQLIRYARTCSNYQDFMERGKVLTQKLLSQGYQKTKLVATLKKFYGRHHDLVNPYNVAVSRIVSDVFASDAP